MSKIKETGRKAGFLQTGLMMLIGAVIGGGGSMLIFLYGEPLQEGLKGLACSISRFSSTALMLLSVSSCLISTILVLRARKNTNYGMGRKKNRQSR